MIGSAGTGTTFGGLQGYLLHGRTPSAEPGLQEYLVGDEERVGWMETRNLLVDDPTSAAEVMAATAEQNVRVKKPVYHLSLSAAPGEELSKKEWLEISERVLRHLGLEEHQALIVAHNDTEHPHIHLMVNRVHPETLKTWHNGHDYRRIEQALRQIERDRGLREVPGRHFQLEGQDRPERQSGPTSGERRETERTGEPTWARQVHFKIYGDLKAAENWGDLERRLAAHGLRLKRRGGGLVITDGDRQVKASRIYRRASYRNLEKRFGMSFEQWKGGKARLVEAIADHQERERERQYLHRREVRAKKAYREAQAAIDKRDEIRGASRRAAASINRALGEIYKPEDVPVARRRLVADARRVGWERTAQRVADHPTRYGRLKGVGLHLRKTMRSKRRRRRSFLVRLPTILRKMAVLRATRLAVGPAGYRAISAGRLATQSWKEIKKQKNGLKGYEASLGEVATRAAGLGINAVSLALAPEPMKLVRTALRTVQLARTLSRGG